MNFCMSSLFFSFFIYLVMRNLLFYTALKYSKGQINAVLFLTFVVDIICLCLWPIMLLMTGGVC